MSILQTLLVIFCVVLTGVIILLSCQLLSTQDVVVCSGSYDKVCTYYKGVLK